jgi:hypothetical protein
VIIIKKIKEGYMPDWGDEVYTVRDRMYCNGAPLGQLAQALVLDRQAMHVLEDANNTLASTNKSMYPCNELMRVEYHDDTL